MAMELHALLPENETPATTEGTEGHHLTSMTGQVSGAKLRIHCAGSRQAEVRGPQAVFLQEVADRMNRRYGPGTVELELRDSYYNMEEQIKPTST